MKRVNLKKLNLVSRTNADSANFAVQHSLKNGDAYQVGNTAYVGRPPIYKNIPADPSQGIFQDRLVKAEKGIPFIRVGVVL